MIRSTSIQLLFAFAVAVGPGWGTTPFWQVSDPLSNSLPEPELASQAVGIVSEDELLTEINSQANVWQGSFPYVNSVADGFVWTAAGESCPPTGFFPHDMSGDVWDWCQDWYRPDSNGIYAGEKAVENPTGPEESFDPRRPDTPQRVQRGGSFLCDVTCSTRYSPSARMGGSPDPGISHVGFRCVISPKTDRTSAFPQICNDFHQRTTL